MRPIVVAEHLKQPQTVRFCFALHVRLSCMGRGAHFGCGSCGVAAQQAAVLVMDPHGSERDRLSGCVQLVASGTQRDPGAFGSPPVPLTRLCVVAGPILTDSWTGPLSSCVSFLWLSPLVLLFCCRESAAVVLAQDSEARRAGLLLTGGNCSVSQSSGIPIRWAFGVVESASSSAVAA